MVAAPPAAAAAMRRGFLVPEIRPLDQYDGARARSAASLAWAIATGYGGAGNVPEELRDPFYTDQYAQEHLKPPVERLLLASDIYCKAFSHALATPIAATPSGAATPLPAPPPEDLGTLLALLAGRGVTPTLQGVPVSEQELRRRPIRMGAHLALIDSLMAAFVAEATRGLGSAGAAQGWEGKILTWLEAVNRKLQESTEKEGVGNSQNSPNNSQNSQNSGAADSSAPPACSHKCPTRWYWKLVPHAIAFCLKESGNKPPVIRYRKDKGAPPAPPPFPPVRGLQDLASGGVLAAAIHFYCPQSLRLEDIRLGAPLALPDRLHNLGLVRDFGARYLRTRCPLAVEDLLYMAPALRLNVGAFLAELFLCFEVLRPPFVTPRQLGGTSESPTAAEAPNPKSSSPGFTFRHPLLAGGGQSPGLLPHSPSLPHGESSFGKAWSKRPLSHPLSQAVSFSIPFGLDSDVDIVMGNPLGLPAALGGPLARSASSDSLAPPRRPPRSVPNGVPEPPEPPEPPPSIEEALQIIHSSERLLPDGAPDAFFLHSPDPQNPPKSPQKHPGEPQNPPKSPLNPPKSPLNPPKSPLNPPQTPSRPMTSFAERKKKLEEASSSAPPNPPGGLPGEPGVSAPPGGPAESTPAALSAEMSQLGARLEEKRRAIEAQKKRIEAIFAKHRQRLGQSALQRLQDGQGASPATPEPESSRGAPPKAPPEQYEAAVARLSAALSSLQVDMQRLTQQQERLLAEQRPPQAWVIPIPKPGRTPEKPQKPEKPPKTAPGSPGAGRRAGPGSAAGSGAGSTCAPGSANPSGAAPPPNPATIATGATRKAAPRSPRRPRPAELRLPPLTRVLSPPHDVDSLPHLRRFSPSQVPVQTRSSLRLAHGPEEEEGEEDEEEERAQPSPGSPPAAGKGALRARACGDGTSDVSLSPGEKGTARRHGEEEEEEEEEEGEGDSLEGSPSEAGNGGQRASVGFFCKLDDDDADEATPPRRAPPPLRQRRLWGVGREQESPLSEPQPLPPQPPPPCPPAVGEGSRRGDFTRLEYERRQQLKLMEELEKVLRPSPPRAPPPPRAPRGAQSRPGGGASAGPRPRCRDDSALGRSPPKGLLGSRLSKVYSQSTLSLSSVAEAGGGRAARAESPSGLGSPSRAAGREWENESNASSPGPEYTGPRLYKEPTARSNRPLIQNALAHCVLAGTPNAPLRNKVLQAMEQSCSPHLLLLLRDGGCQFRGLYALAGSPPALRRLSGSGPRRVPLPAVQSLYKYQCDQRRFCRLPARTFSGSVDAFSIAGHLWHPKRPQTPK